MFCPRLPLRMEKYQLRFFAELIHYKTIPHYPEFNYFRIPQVLIQSYIELAPCGLQDPDLPLNIQDPEFDPQLSP